MPNNYSPGELEDFIRELIPGKDPTWPRAKHYIVRGNKLRICQNRRDHRALRGAPLAFL